MKETIQQRAMRYLYSQLRKTRMNMCRAEEKENSTAEMANLRNKIEVLEWLTDVAINGGDPDD